MIRKYHDANMTEGALFGKIFIFALPIMLTGILQLFFNAADIAVVGRYAENGDIAVGAVGACTSLINLIVNIAMGLSVGVGVSVAHDVGSGEHDRLHKVVHTAVSFGAVLGIVVAVFGFAFAEPLLTLMGTPDNVLKEAVPYMKAYFVGVPACMVYNYAAAAIRSSGDTTKPLIFLAVSGVTNVILNLIMVIVFGMGAVGVGISTAASQYVSMTLALIYMLKTNGVCRIDITKLVPRSDAVARILRVGVPSGLQSMLFSFSNVLIQSTVNSFGDTVISGHATAANVDGFVYMCIYSVSQAIIVFAGQNMGAGKYHRLDRVLLCGLGLVTAVGVTTSTVAMIFGRPLLNFYTPDAPLVVEAGMRRLWVVCAPYFLCGLMDTSTGALRGMGASISPMLISVMGVCGFRIGWIFTVFAIPEYHTLEVLFLVYPISWVITAIAQFVAYLLILKSHRKRFAKQQE